MAKAKFKFIPKEGNDTDVLVYLNELSIDGTISEKMGKLVKMSVLTTHDLNNRQRIVDDIRILFQHFYPDCKLLPFGSTINGFGTKGCDIDLIFSPFDYENLDPSKIIDDDYVPTIREAREDPSILSHLKYMSKNSQLCFLLRVLRNDKRHRYYNSIFIPAKCPIVRFLISSKHYDVWCDLSLQHGLASLNSALLCFFCKFDSRIRPLMITLRFWAKHLNIINVTAFSSYAFSLLVIFFLQNVEEPILPPVEDLMTDAESYVVDGWEAGFKTEVPKNFVSRNALTEEELLKHFFKFYFSFDFTKNVVCIRTGKATPVSDFRKNTDERMKNFLIGDVCVQDPFILSHNVASSTKIHKLHLLKPYFFVADLILSNQFQSPESQDAFRQLFDSFLFEVKIQDYFFFHGSDEAGCFYVYPNFEVIALIGDDFKKIWYEQASQGIRNILEYIFLFECEVLDKSDFSFSENHQGADMVACCSKKVEENNQEDWELLLSIQCAVDNTLWKHRFCKKDVVFDSYMQDFDNEVLKKENALSLCLLEAGYASQSSKALFWFMCNLYKSKFSEVPCIWIDITPLTTNKEIGRVGRVLRQFIPTTLQKMLLSKDS